MMKLLALIHFIETHKWGGVGRALELLEHFVFCNSIGSLAKKKLWRFRLELIRNIFRTGKQENKETMLDFLEHWALPIMKVL